VWNYRRIKLTVGLIYAFCQIFFLINLEYPKGLNFDEFHYVPSAKQFLELKTNQNWEHPPLGKLLMAVGIGVWGDHPIGWRAMSTVFGSLTCVGMYLLALVLFKTEEAALWTLGITLANQMVYVQSRIGMLDTFMFAFIVWALVTFFATFLPIPPGKQTLRWPDSRLLNCAGILLGLATACKWFGFIPWASCVAIIVVVRGVQLQTPRNRQPPWIMNLWKKVTLLEFAIAFLLLPFISYALTFIPYLFIKEGGYANLAWWDIPLEWWNAQLRMYDGQLRVISSHPYMSQWTDWPLLSRPIWYAFEPDADDKMYVRGVILLGNPWIMWLGLLALAFCFWDGLKKLNPAGLVITFFYSTFLGCWLFIPRKIAFYYYYYPCGMMLGLACTYFFFSPQPKAMKEVQKLKWVFLGFAIVFFIYFFPILAGLKIPTSSYIEWMWFKSWI
jgi:dolichyl-phosphate-mannose--protein O-mannosyl transferase